MNVDIMLADSEISTIRTAISPTCCRSGRRTSFLPEKEVPEPMMRKPKTQQQN